MPWTPLSINRCRESSSGTERRKTGQRPTCCYPPPPGPDHAGPRTAGSRDGRTSSPPFRRGGHAYALGATSTGRRRVKPGQSGNPSGRPKGSQYLKTLFNKVLAEEISLREGADVKKISKAEAIIRSVCGASDASPSRRRPSNPIAISAGVAACSWPKAASGPSSCIRRTISLVSLRCPRVSS
jgi:hypothetical protein